MNDTTRAAVDRFETKVKDKVEKLKDHLHPHHNGTDSANGPDPYCCTPPGGDGSGADTKP